MSLVSSSAKKISDSMNSLKNIDPNSKKLSRREKILFLISETRKSKLEVPPNLEKEALAFCKKASTIKLVDAMIYPNLNQVLALQNMVLHLVGEVLYKETFDKVYQSVLDQMAAADKETREKGSEGKSYASKKSRKSKKRKPNSQDLNSGNLEDSGYTKQPPPSTSKNSKNSKNPKNSKQTYSQVRSDNKVLSESRSRSTNSNKSDDANFKNKRESRLDSELKELQKQYAQDDNYAWINIQSNPLAASNRHLPKEGHSHNSSISIASGVQKPRSMMTELPSSLPFMKRTNSFTNSKIDRKSKNPLSYNTNTLSTMTESIIKKSMQAHTEYGIHRTKPSELVREVSHDSISLKSKKSANFSAGGSTDLEGGQKYPETNSIERNLSNNKKKKYKMIDPKDGTAIRDHQRLMTQKLIEGRLPLRGNRINYSAVVMSSGGAMRSRKRKEVPTTPPNPRRVAQLEHGRGGAAGLQSIKDALTGLKLTEEDFPEIQSPLYSKRRKQSDIQSSKKRSSNRLKMIREGHSPEILLRQFKKTSKTRPTNISDCGLSEALAKDQAKLFFNQVLNKSVKITANRIKAIEDSKEPSRMAIFERIREVVKSTFRGKVPQMVDICVFGSWATKILIPSSDIDLCVLGFENYSRPESIEVLRRLEESLNGFKFVGDLQGIYSATVPVIKLVSHLFFYSLLDEKVAYSIGCRSKYLILCKEISGRGRSE